MQIQNMNLKLNMKDINKILAKAHFKSNFFFKWCEETTLLHKHVSMTLHDVWAHWSYIWAQKILCLSAKKSTIERILP
jgi:hypothetical protein